MLTHLITTLGVHQPIKDFFTTYNGMLHPDAIMGGWMRYQNKDINNDILISYGYGDGGGGSTRENARDLDSYGKRASRESPKCVRRLRGLSLMS